MSHDVDLPALPLQMHYAQCDSNLRQTCGQHNFEICINGRHEVVRHELNVSLKRLLCSIVQKATTAML